MEHRYKNPGVAKAATGASSVVLLGGEPLEDTSSPLNIQESCTHLHGLGPRVVGEFVRELVGHDADLQADVGLLLERYGHLSPAMVSMVGGAS
jgi:hypothetical protein